MTTSPPEPRTPVGAAASKLPSPLAAPVHERAAGAVRAYYDATRADYRLLWFNRRNLALHFGYWDERAGTHAASLVRLNEVLAEQMGIRRGDRVLDAGCGIGGSAVWLAEEYGAEVVGVNLVGHQVAEATSRARRRGLGERVSFVQGDYCATGLPEGQFDAVWALESLCHAPDKPRFLAEARRLLRPGGRLGVVEYLRDRRPAGEDEALLRRWLDAWAIPDLATADELARWAREAGFADGLLVDASRNVEPSLRRLDRIATVLRPGAALLHRIGIRSATQHGNVLASRWLYQLFRRGVWRETIFTATAPR